MPRIQGLTDTPQVLTDDALLKTGQGYVFSITLSWQTAVVGERIVLRDGTDGAAKVLVCFIVSTINGTITKSWENGKLFTAGLFYDPQVSGASFAELTYR